MKRWIFAGLAIALLLAGAFLMRSADEVVLPKKVKRNFPTHLDSVGAKRAAKRRTHTRRLLQDLKIEEKDKVVDPLYLALPDATKSGFGVVLEANALAHSDLGNMLLSCMGASELEGLTEMKDEFNFDPLQDLDRAAFFDKLVVATGDFAAFRKKLDEAPDEQQAYGDQGVLFSAKDGDNFAIWNDEMLMFGDSEDELRAMIDRLEGRSPPAESIIKPEMAYGEVYGVAGPELLAKLIESEDPQVRQLAEAVENIELHVNTSEGLALSLHAQGSDEARLEDLAKSLGAALAVQRMMKGADSEFGKFLEDSRVLRTGGGKFTVELAANMDMLREQLGPCASKDRTADRTKTKDGLPNANGSGHGSERSQSPDDGM